MLPHTIPSYTQIPNGTETDVKEVMRLTKSVSNGMVLHHHLPLSNEWEENWKNNYEPAVWRKEKTLIYSKNYSSNYSGDLHQWEAFQKTSYSGFSFQLFIGNLAVLESVNTNLGLESSGSCFVDSLTLTHLISSVPRKPTIILGLISLSNLQSLLI